jgi:hypothetical protein
MSRRREAAKDKTDEAGESRAGFDERKRKIN